MAKVKINPDKLKNNPLANYRYFKRETYGRTSFVITFNHYPTGMELGNEKEAKNYCEQRNNA